MRRFNHFLDAFGEKHPVTVELLKEFQKRLTQNTYDTRRWQLGERPGEFKRHDYVTGRNEIGAAPDDVEEEVAELLAELREVNAEKALTAAACFHAKLENIHPFADGNGRAGRLVMNYFLVLHGHPPIIIHEEDRKEYYTALEAWDTDQRLGPLTTFLKEQTAKTWAKQVERVEKKISKKQTREPLCAAPRSLSAVLFHYLLTLPIWKRLSPSRRDSFALKS